MVVAFEVVEIHDSLMHEVRQAFHDHTTCLAYASLVLVIGDTLWTVAWLP
jgi:hypothetical protein